MIPDLETIGNRNVHL